MLFKTTLVFAAIFVLTVSRKKENAKQDNSSEHVFDNVSLRVVLHQKNSKFQLQPADFLKLLSNPTCKQKVEIRPVIVEDEGGSEGLKEYLEITIGHQNCVIETPSNQDTNGAVRNLLGSIWLSMIGISDWFKRNLTAISGAVLGVNFYLIIKGLMEYWNNYTNLPDPQLLNLEAAILNQPPRRIQIEEQQKFERRQSKGERNHKHLAHGSHGKKDREENTVNKKKRKNEHVRRDAELLFTQGFSSNQSNNKTEGYWELLDKVNKN